MMERKSRLLLLGLLFEWLFPRNEEGGKAAELGGRCKGFARCLSWWCAKSWRGARQLSLVCFLFVSKQRRPRHAGCRQSPSIRHGYLEAR